MPGSTGEAGRLGHAGSRNYAAWGPAPLSPGTRTDQGGGIPRPAVGVSLQVERVWAAGRTGLSWTTEGMGHRSLTEGMGHSPSQPGRSPAARFLAQPHVTPPPIGKARPGS